MHHQVCIGKLDMAVYLLTLLLVSKVGLLVAQEEDYEEKKPFYDSTSLTARRFTTMSNILITGISEKGNSVLLSQIEGVGHKLGFTDPLNDVQWAKRLLSHHSPRPIIVRMINRTLKTKWVHFYRKKKLWVEKIYLCEYLPRQVQELLLKTKEWATKMNFKSVWSWNSNVWMQRNSTYPREKVIDFLHLQFLMKKAALEKFEREHHMERERLDRIRKEKERKERLKVEENKEEKEKERVEVEEKKEKESQKEAEKLEKEKEINHRRKRSLSYKKKEKKEYEKMKIKKEKNTEQTKKKKFRNKKGKTKEEEEKEIEEMKYEEFMKEVEEIKKAKERDMTTTETAFTASIEEAFDKMNWTNADDYGEGPDL
uniref:Uncharacterized protein n=1 Tax=Cacopsylla melanoneura TaxID=428564 RepID=A0A8D8T1L0_9HEMI